MNNCRKRETADDVITGRWRGKSNESSGAARQSESDYGMPEEK